MIWKIELSQIILGIIQFTSNADLFKYKSVYYHNGLSV